MASIVDAFKLKSFDLDPVYASWPAAPRFYGQDPNKKSKGGVRDLPVDDWLKAIKEGCVQRNVPKDYWHRVGQHYMGDSARQRLDEVHKVMMQMHGGKYRWDWKKYKTAMKNMGWDLDIKRTETVKFQAKQTGGGFWWITGKREEKAETTPAPTPPQPIRASTIPWISRAPSSESTIKVKTAADTERPTASRQSSMASEMKLWPTFGRHLKADQEADKENAASRPAVQKSKSDTFVLIDGKGEEETTAQAPTWLLNACNALDFLSNDHTKVMSTMGAILVTIGSIPSIPAVAAGAGGAVLASHAVQTIGAIAVGVGSLLKAQGDKAGEENKASEATSSSGKKA